MNERMGGGGAMFKETLVMKNVGEYLNKDWDMSLFLA